MDFANNVVAPTVCLTPFGKDSNNPYFTVRIGPVYLLPT
jgi:hypothetical protein